MRTKFSGILTLLLAFVVQLTFAQEKTISGNVTDNLGMPLPGVNIIVKGTSNGTQSDFDGNYTIQANVGQTLEFSYVGFKSVDKSISASTSTINVQMEEDAAVLDEVVVTASGIKKEKKALGYAVSSVNEEQIKNNPEADLTRVLQGKSAGVNITTQNGVSGSANKVIIRGMLSFSGSNNALYVVDGVPISNDANPAGNFIDGNLASSRSFDIDPNNIEKVDILKGLAATTLYGTEGRNGVILITTKTGSTKKLNSKQEVEVSTSFFFNEVAALPDYQNKYGGGFDQAFGWFYSNWGPGFYKDGLGGWGSDAAFDENGTLPHPYSTSSFLASNYPDYQAQFEGQRYDWRPRTSVEDFFRSGAVSNSSINLRGRSEDNNYTYGVAFSTLSEEGFTPGNKVTRNNLTVSGSAKLTNKVNVRGSLSYALTNLKTPPIAASFGSSVGGAGSSVFGDLFYTPRSVDFFELPFELPDGGSIYYRNDNAIQHPLWTVKNARLSQLTNRVTGFGSIDYNLTDHINVLYQGSVDNYSENTVNRQNRGGVSDSETLNSGIYSTYNTTSTIYDHKLVVSGNGYKFGGTENDNFTFGYLLGATTRSISYRKNGVSSNDQQVFGFFDHSGFVNQSPIEDKVKRNIAGLFGQINFDYKDMIYLNLAGRNDWVSNQVNNSLFYPSASISFIPTKAFEGLQSENGINFLKLRAGYGTSANFASRYPTATSVVLNTQAFIDDGGNFVTTNTTSSSFGNRAIKPELFEELEFGVEARLFSRVNLDLSYYTRTTTDLIINSRPIPASTGGLSTASNIGQIDSFGYEADVNADIFKSDDGFNWNFGVNFTAYESEVIDLGDDSDIIVYAGFTNRGNAAVVGNPLGAIYGSRVARDESGNLLVDDAGNYLSESVDENGILPMIGDANPDFVMNYTSTFSYKGFNLSFLVNHVSGGDIYSVTIASLLGRGLTTDTEDRLGTFVLPGVNATTGEPNNVQINNSDYYFGNIFAGPADELSVFDGSVIRLQEVSLGYTFKANQLEKTPFGRITIKLSGYNMWYDAYNTPDGINFDPNVSALGSGNGQGFDYLTGPSSKKYGISINATF